MRHTGGMAEPAPPPRLVSDLHRNTVAVLISTGVTVVAFFVYNAFVPIVFSADSVAIVSFVFWIVYSLSTAVLTHFAMRRISGPQLSAWLLATTPKRRAQRIETTLAGAGPNINVTWAILAIFAVGMIIVVPGLLDSPLANTLGFAVVVSSWIVTVYAYAVHYARVNATEPSVDFPGKEKSPVFADYLYLSVQLATTFSSSDVNILTTRARRIVTGQTLIAYAYTTFIIALLIAVLFLSN